MRDIINLNGFNHSWRPRDDELTKKVLDHTINVPNF